MNLPITNRDVRSARERLKGIAHHTPVFTSRSFNDQAGCEVFFKCENLQRAGAFKFRGAFNTLSRLSDEQQQRGVIAFSSGNHAQATALAARMLGIPAVICMPQDAPSIKVKATQSYGAEVVFYDRWREDREEVARRIAAKRNLTLIPPYNHPHIMAGAGTAALELLEEVPDLDALVTPVGGGGLIAGTAVAARGTHPRIRIFGVEPEDADDTRRSLHEGKRITIPPPNTIADGLRITTPGELTFPVIQTHVEDIVTVSEDMIRNALRFVLLRLKLVTEPSGAVPLAALLHRRLPEGLRRVGVIISGGNIDPAWMGTLFDTAETG